MPPKWVTDYNDKIDSILKRELHELIDYSYDMRPNDYEFNRFELTLVCARTKYYYLDELSAYPDKIERDLVNIVKEAHYDIAVEYYEDLVEEVSFTDHEIHVAIMAMVIGARFHV